MPKIREVSPAPLNGLRESDDSLDTSMPTGAISRNVTLPPPKCLVTAQPDGSLAVSFLIESTEANRIIRRAGNMDLSRYLWENILHRAVSDHVY